MAVKFFQSKKKKFLKAIEDDPQTPDNYLRLGKLYFLNGDYDDAAEVYKDGLKNDPRNISLLFNYAVNREAQNEIDGAKKIYLEILSIDPNNKSTQERLDKITDF
ncbi:MAG: tetratricopeptide repeat protein [Candidatus Auribacterota bacterium]|nr:tetratricopeptide repeat protein [Candidatus Auribacterota bacterium]